MEGVGVDADVFGDGGVGGFGACEDGGYEFGGEGHCEGCGGGG